MLLKEIISIFPISIFILLEFGWSMNKITYILFWSNIKFTPEGLNFFWIVRFIWNMNSVVFHSECPGVCFVLILKGKVIFSRGYTRAKVIGNCFHIGEICNHIIFIMKKLGALNSFQQIEGSSVNRCRKRFWAVFYIIEWCC